MSEKRKDNRGRILHNGESQMPDGRYRFRYTDSFGETKTVYSWRLTHSDPTPYGKKTTPAIRDMKKQIEADVFDHIVSNGGNLTVMDLVEKYIATKTGVRKSTTAGYKTVINYLKTDEFSRRRIDTVRISDAKLWLIKLQKNGKSYSSIHTIRGVLRPAFQMAMDDDYIRKNPFQFQLVDVLVNDSVRREAITKEQERNFLKFVKEDIHFKRYYDVMFILFKTGMRIGEFCGLTVSDIDFDTRSISISKQLQRRPGGLYIESTKTEAGTRVIPMSSEVEQCFKNLIANRKPPKIEPMVDGVTGFLTFNHRGLPSYESNWAKYFSRAVEKYNEIYVAKMPKITPHVCRHTYCSNMAKSGMNPKTLQYLMGHSDISVTMNTYAHVNYDDAVAEVSRLGIV
ncbi:MAG: tyrosine-type recombinase/integrase [Saccharofermentans sp.]|nr:tyrosine-type recombinase/integrase [Saccharofermentans sp.]